MAFNFGALAGSRTGARDGGGDVQSHLAQGRPESRFDTKGNVLTATYGACYAVY